MRQFKGNLVPGSSFFSIFKSLGFYLKLEDQRDFIEYL